MDKILILNLGTTSFKCKLFQCTDAVQTVIAEGELESVGAKRSPYVLHYADGRCRKGIETVKDHTQAFSLCLGMLQQDGILKGLEDLSAVGYKAVHGGSLSGTCLVDDELLAEMERVMPLAPAHNPIYLAAMKDIAARFPGLTQVARFETSFHETIPAYRTTYGVPWQWREELGIRKYGFHGSSHQYIALKMQQLQPEAKRIICCHLGGSSSVCAILEGKSVATTMGATPQSGLFCNNRVGDFEVFCLPALTAHYGSVEAVMKILSSESGLLGLSGVSNDLREVLVAMDAGNLHAKLAVEVLVDNIVGYVGMYTAYLGGLDALVFTGGIGLNSGRIRLLVCEKLAYLGLKLDAERNDDREASCISAENSQVQVWRLKTNEELVVVRCVYEYLHR